LFENDFLLHVQSDVELVLLLLLLLVVLYLLVLLLLPVAVPLRKEEKMTRVRMQLLKSRQRRQPLRLEKMPSCVLQKQPL
jgi:hypothetical protein